MNKMNKSEWCNRIALAKAVYGRSLLTAYVRAQ